MTELKYPVIVEGKYDKIRLDLIIKGNIITTDGFGIFGKNEKLALIKKLAEKTPIIVICDSDGAGSVIRNYINSAIPKERLIHLYIPEIFGKEKRKKEPSKAGTLGVEGMECELLEKMLSPYAADADDKTRIKDNPLSKIDFYNDGLSGGKESAQKRDKLAHAFELPRGMSANALLAALKIICTYEEYKEAVKNL